MTQKKKRKNPERSDRATGTGRSKPQSVLKVAAVKGAPGWLLDGEPYVPILAQAGRGGLADIQEGKLRLPAEVRVRTTVPAGLGSRFTLACTLSCDSPDTGQAGPYVLLDGRNAQGRPKRYSMKLDARRAGLWAAHSQILTPAGTCVIGAPVRQVHCKPVRLRLAKCGATLAFEVNGTAAGEWTDPDPMARLDQIWLVGAAAPVVIEALTLTNGSGTVVFRELFDDAQAVRRRFFGDLKPLGPLPGSSFFAAGCDVYTTWEHGPQLSLVWKADGTYDWSEVDGYLRKLAALDPSGRIQFRFFFDAPAWWARQNPDQMVHVRQADGKTASTGIVSFASKTFWAEAEQAARDLVRYCAQHPEGWRFVGVLYSSGHCEWFPHWGAGYSDYSPAFLDGFREWLQTRYGTVGRLRAAWKDAAVTFGTATLPTPAERVQGDFYEFYDPAKGLHRQDFGLYYSEVVTRLIERLARAFKEASSGRVFTRVMAGYQPGGRGFRYHAGPHADFAAVLKCPWLDSFFMPNDYRGRGVNGFTGFEIPIASVLLHGKTYITEVDDRTHPVESFLFGTAESPWHTAQALKRTVAAAICQASGAEFKDWAAGWFEDDETQSVIRKLNVIAQESTRHDRTPTAEIAVILNPRSTCHVRDGSLLYDTLNNQQMHLCYPRIGAPHDRLLVDDLALARDYKLYIVQDALHLTDAQRRLIKRKICTKGHTVLWIYAPGVVGERSVGAENISKLVGMRIRCRETYEHLHLHLHLSAGAHPYNRGIPAGTGLNTWEGFYPLFYVDDPQATTLGWGGDVHNSKPAFAVKPMADWTSVYCSVPVLPPTVIRNIAREAGVHIYSEMDDFVAANNWLLTLCASNDGLRTVRLPRRATVIDAMTGARVANGTDRFDVTLKFGETAVWKMESKRDAKSKS